MRLKRTEWLPPVRGTLFIGWERVQERAHRVAKLTIQEPQVTRFILQTIFGVETSSFERGLMVSGYQIQSKGAGEEVHEVRMIWYCVPVA